jgi:hypothetical protein
MNTKQIVALVVGVTAAGVTLTLGMRSSGVSSTPIRTITSSVGVTYDVVDDYLPKEP